ncbi:transcription factor, putative, partial [Ixodes scapularis]
FQYFLGAATSIATKLHEETMTYLNQGQSYEIKLKKLGDLTEMRGKMLKSTIRIGFQERRLQYMEKEQISQWTRQRPGERILEADVPLSYGVYEVVNAPSKVHFCEFLWDPTKETGVFVRLNCISTEFTPKKHGGEKGVPFRIVIETYSHGEPGPPQKLHSASCQVKVFKPKGADRKHKTDREKMMKRPQSEQEKHQPSYDCTVFTEVTGSPAVPAVAPTPPPPHKAPTSLPSSVVSCSPPDQQPQQQQQPQTRPGSSSYSPGTSAVRGNRKGEWLAVYSSFAGADVLRLTRDDLIQICGLADGIRLYNALHSRNIRPRLTTYICLASEQAVRGRAFSLSGAHAVFRAVYLKNLTVLELLTKLADLCSLSPFSVHEVYIDGPSGIHVLVTDEVVRNMADESMYILELLRGK